jgi:hypothetical protein
MSAVRRERRYPLRWTCSRTPACTGTLHRRNEMKSFETAISIVLVLATQALTIGVIFAA